MRFSRLVWVAALVVLLGIAAYAWYPPFRLLILATAGRSRVCPLSHALKVDEHRRALTAAKDRILAASRLMQKDEQQGLELWQTPKGLFWIPTKNQYVLPFNLAEMELRVYGSGDRFVRPGDIVLDCGASDGDFTREALAAGARLVVAIEVAPLNVECLRRNLASEVASGRAIVFPEGVWDKDDTLTLNVVDDNFAANSVVARPERSRASVRVPLTTIDKIVTRLKLERVDFIKMDVEGAETRAIAGARDTLLRYKPRLSITTEHGPEDELLIPQAVRNVRADYVMECGPCLESDGHIRADVLYFH